MPDPETIAAIRAVAAQQQRAPLVQFLDGLHSLTRRATNTRPTDWAVAIRLGPMTLYQALEGGPAAFRPLTGRCQIEYRQRRWLLPLLRSLRGRLLGRWAGRGRHPGR
jgi:hypothetical protein